MITYFTMNLICYFAIIYPLIVDKDLTWNDKLTMTMLILVLGLPIMFVAACLALKSIFVRFYENRGNNKH